jgi:hypothetical protein
MARTPNGNGGGGRVAPPNPGTGALTITVKGKLISTHSPNAYNVTEHLWAHKSGKYGTDCPLCWHAHLAEEFPPPEGMDPEHYGRQIMTSVKPTLRLRTDEQYVTLRAGWDGNGTRRTQAFGIVDKGDPAYRDAMIDAALRAGRRCDSATSRRDYFTAVLKDGYGIEID